MPDGHAGPDRLRRLFDAAVSVGANLDLRTVLERVVNEAVALAGARYGALGVLDPDGDGLSDFVTVGIDDEQRAAIGELPKGLGLLKHVAEENQPLLVSDLSEHLSSVGFPEHHPPMASFLGIPLRVGDEVFGNLYLTDKIDGEAFTDVDLELVNAFAAAAGIAIRNARLFETVAHREAVIDAFGRVATALLSGADRDEVLDLLAERARELVAADSSAIVLHHPSGGVYLPVADGEEAEIYRGKHFPSDGSPTEHVIATGQSIMMDNLSELPQVADRVLGQLIGPIMMVPIVIDGPLGSLTVSRFLGEKPFTKSELEVLRSFAAQASIVLEYDRRREREDLLARIQDQRRIAEDLHDSAIQEIFAATLGLSSAMTKVSDETARDQIGKAVDGLDRAIRLVRNVIFDLAASGSSSGTSVRRQILHTAADAGVALGFDVDVVFDGPIDTEMSADLCEQLLLVVKEALSNVARHADADAATVEVTATTDEIVAIVRDNGVGISATHRIGNGTVNMVNRAERFGGTCTIAASPSGGTVVCWRVPSAP